MSDRFFGLIVAIVALAYMASATQIQLSFLTDPVGPKLFPYIIGGVALLCAIAVMINPDDAPAWPSGRIWLSLLICVVVLVGYAFALKPVGFLIPTAIAAGVLSYQIGHKPGAAVLTGLGLSIGLFLVFKYALGLGLFAVSRELGTWLGL